MLLWGIKMRLLATRLQVDGFVCALLCSAASSSSRTRMSSLLLQSAPSDDSAVSRGCREYCWQMLHVVRGLAVVSDFDLELVVDIVIAVAKYIVPVAANNEAFAVVDLPGNWRSYH
ncbi:hypothetical protein ACLKA6_012778 [Drosophila palustris]